MTTTRQRSRGSSNPQFSLWWWLGVTFILMGALPALIGVGFVIRSVSQWIGTSSTEGTVIALEKSRSPISSSSGLRKRGTPSASYAPVVRFKVDDQTYSVDGLAATTQTPYQVGQKVKVLYRTTQPSQAYIDSFTERWLGAVICTGVGALFIIPGILFLRQGKRQKN
jgi:hypothetical protein